MTKISPERLAAMQASLDGGARHVSMSNSRGAAPATDNRLMGPTPTQGARGQKFNTI